MLARPEDMVSNDFDGPYPGFQGHFIFEVDCQKQNNNLRKKLPYDIGNHT